MSNYEVIGLTLGAVIVGTAISVIIIVFSGRANTAPPADLRVNMGNSVIEATSSRMVTIRTPGPVRFGTDGSIRIQPHPALTPDGAYYHQVINKYYDLEGKEIAVRSSTHIVDDNCCKPGMSDERREEVRLMLHTLDARAASLEAEENTR